MVEFFVKEQMCLTEDHPTIGWIEQLWLISDQALFWNIHIHLRANRITIIQY